MEHSPTHGSRRLVPCPGRTRPCCSAQYPPRMRRKRRPASSVRVRLMRMVAAVLGGGTGQRIGAALPKQLLRLSGRTLLEHCVAAFEQAPGIDEILVVMAAAYVEQARAM